MEDKVLLFSDKSKLLTSFFLYLADNFGLMPILSKSLGNKLMAWFLKNKRPLPWRKTKDPYKIWLSEIILQQTQVKQGIPYYEKFIKYYPTVEDLALAKEDDILKMWEGLGYYSRARNMHIAANQILLNHGGRFPEEYNTILTLRGVGAYTAAAISSIAFGLKHAVVDGNVLRYICRLKGIEIPKTSSSCYRLVEKEVLGQMGIHNPGDFNEAIMEFGALFCKPKAPKCNHCFAIKECYAYKEGKINFLPIKTKSKNIRKRYFNYFVIITTEGIPFVKRKGNDIWSGLYDFPMIESDKKKTIQITLDDFLKKYKIKDYTKHKNFPWKPQRLSHQMIFTRFIVIQLAGALPEQNKMYNFVSLKNLRSLASPKSIIRFLDENAIYLKSFYIN